MANAKPKFAVYGTGGFAREVLPLIYQQYGLGVDIVFVDDATAMYGKLVNNVRVVGFEQAVAEARKFSIAIGDCSLRQKLALKCEDAGVEFVDVIAKSHEQYLVDEQGDGLIACANSIFTSNCKIGKHFHANIYSYVAHDCHIGNYVTFAPRVNCNGNIVVEDLVYVGTGAVLRQGSPGKPLVIGRGAIIGMGAVVTRDVAANTTVVGNPARLLK